MRWVAFILLLFGAYFSLSAYAPAAPGHASLARPFDGPAVAREAGHSSFRVVAVEVLAAAAAALFVVSEIGLFSSNIPETVWPVFVSMAIAASLPVYLLHLGRWMAAPIAVDAALAAGLVTGSWSSGVTRMRTLQSAEQRIHPLMRIPVPWVFILGFLIGVAMHFLAPIKIDSAGFQRGYWIAGGVFIAAGVVLAGWSLGLFKKANTTTIPYENASALVTHGPYRFSRNPMYIALTLVYLGAAGMWNQLWPLAVLPLVLLYIHRVVIPEEEKRLTAVFGETYTDYCARVRRWL